MCMKVCMYVCEGCMFMCVKVCVFMQGAIAQALATALYNDVLCLVCRVLFCFVY